MQNDGAHTRPVLDTLQKTVGETIFVYPTEQTLATLQQEVESLCLNDVMGSRQSEWIDTCGKVTTSPSEDAFGLLDHVMIKL